jgi:DNA-binding transcriptional MerR regulator
MAVKDNTKVFVDSPPAGGFTLSRVSEPRSSELFSIGEFSRITGITVKALRLYHEQRLLTPTLIDRDSGYRFYAPSLIERASAISLLRRLEFSLEQIGEILGGEQDEQSIVQALQRHKSSIEQRIRHLRDVAKSLDQFIQQERQANVMMQSNSDVHEKTIDAQLIAGVRMKGRYAESGKGFAKIGRAFGRFIAGPCFMLHYDTEYKEDDADFEACMPLKKSGKDVDGISLRELPGAKCVCLIHKGPYEQLGPSYAKALKYAKDRGYAIASPTREVYLKGPGMIFKGNPKNYITEIQLPIQ